MWLEGLANQDAKTIGNGQLLRMVLVATPVLAVSTEYRVATPMVVAACAVVAWRSRRFTAPLRALVVPLFLGLGPVTLQQGPSLPAAE